MNPYDPPIATDEDEQARLKRDRENAPSVLAAWIILSLIIFYAFLVAYGCGAQAQDQAASQDTPKAAVGPCLDVSYIDYNAIGELAEVHPPEACNYNETEE